MAEAFPVRLSIMTLNVWGENLWPERSEALSQLLTGTRPDILVLQEVTPAIITFLEHCLGDHDRIVDDGKPGWTREGNIFWNKNLFVPVEFGSCKLNMADYPHRDLFWARLAIKAKPALTLLVSTAHFPWPGCDKELETGINQRILATNKACEHLRALFTLDEPAIFAGDFNDDFHPIRILNDELGLIDVFESLDLPPAITHPVRPSSAMEESRPSRTIDWITASLPHNCRVLGAYTKQIRGGRFPPASDHLPVIAFIEIGSNH